MEKERAYTGNGSYSLRLAQGVSSKPGIRTLASLLGVVAFCCVLIAFVSDSQSRMKRYEHELIALRANIRQSSTELKERMKREIANSVISQENQEHDISKRDNKEASESYGVAYTRWGRRDCHGSGKLLYKGLAAGTHYSHSGGGSNYICLNNFVDYVQGRYVDGNQGSSHIYGVEFRDSAWISPLFDLTDTENQALQFHSLPCAVCMAELKVNQIMIPGRDTCPEDWHVEYTGYVMAGSHGDKHPSEFICVDDRPQVVPGTHGDQKGSFLFMVETQCASLLCEPFVAGRELRCVVCTI